MRARTILTFAVLAALLVGCGARSLILNVDVLSFMDPADRQKDFGPIPAFPGGIATGEVTVIDDQHVNLLEGLGDASSIQSVEISFGAHAIDFDGSGADTVRVYMSDEATDPLTTTPVLMVPVTLTPASTDTILATIGNDPRVRDLFSKKAMRVSVTTSLRGPSAGPDLSGRLQLTRIYGTVIAGWKGF